MLPKGQLISKRNFGFLEFFQKTKENIRHSTVTQKTEFVRSFFGRTVGLKEPLRLCLTFSKGYVTSILVTIPVQSNVNLI